MSRPEWRQARNRSHASEEDGLRFSVNHSKNGSYPAWQRMKQTICSDTSVVGMALSEALQGEYHVKTYGGDFVHPGALTGQHLHVDGSGPGGWDERPKDRDEEFSPWVVCSFAVHDISFDQAPLLSYGWEAMRLHCNPTPPKRGEDLSVPPADSRVSMLRGDILIRNPKVWHAGSGNCTDRVRYLPGMVLERLDHINM